MKGFWQTEAHKRRALLGARWARIAALVVALPTAACGNGAADPGQQAFFPSDYLDTYTEVYDCRSSGDHDLNMVRMLADPDALGPYRDREESFPIGSVVLKEEYEFGDDACAGPIKQWTVMRRLEAGTAPETLDWQWQRVDADRHVLDSDAARCISCHSGCGVAPDGYEGTCVIP